MQSRSVGAFSTTLAILWAIHLPAVGLSQTPLEFEAAAIRPSNPQGPRIDVGIHVDGAQVRYTLMPLISLVGYAFDVPPYRIVGPDWLGSAFYDVTAKLPDGAAATQAPEMLRGLLADRFGLRVHRDTREFPVYALEISKGGVRMQELPPEPTSESHEEGAVNVSVVTGARGGTFDLGKGSSFAIGTKGLQGKRLFMAALANMLTPFLDRPAVDMTGLKGAYDLALDLSPEDLRSLGLQSAINVGAPVPPGAAQSPGVTASLLAGAMQKTLGLTLTPRKAPLEVIVVDAIQKTPTAN